MAWFFRSENLGFNRIQRLGVRFSTQNLIKNGEERDLNNDRDLTNESRIWVQKMVEYALLVAFE